MLVNQMQRDLISSNLLECCGALIAVTNLITSDLVGTVSTQVMGLLEHTAETVRKKAIIALHRLHQLAPDIVTKQEVTDKVRKLLCDRDPAVMGSTLNVIETLARVDVQPFKDLVPSLISILKQICERRLPSEYDYHRIPAPWMQMKIVRILSVIGKNDMACSEGMYEILGNAYERRKRLELMPPMQLCMNVFVALPIFTPTQYCWMRRGRPYRDSCPRECRIFAIWELRA